LLLSGGKSIGVKLKYKTTLTTATTTMDEPLKVTRVTVAELSMIVPPFIAQHGSIEDKALASELLRVTKETRVLLGQFFLYTAMPRSKESAAACKRCQRWRGDNSWKSCQINGGIDSRAF
jgi:hypothetical protein